MSVNSGGTEAVMPLYIWPRDADLTRLKAIVQGMGLPFKVRPFWYEPGHVGKILALEPGCPWLWDHIEPKSDRQMQLAVNWCLGLEDLERGPKTLEANLEAVFGEVNEIGEDGFNVRHSLA